MSKRRFHDSLWKPAGQAINEHQMIQEGDQIAVGVSGGKDSMTLLYVLNEIKKFSPVKFGLHAITVDLGFGNSLLPIRDFCRDIGVSWSQVHTKIAPIVFEYRKEPNPCSLCSKMRNGALHIAAKKMGCSKVALAHSLDDAIETFLLCLFYERRIKLMQPVSYLSRRKVTLIRPLIYVHEISIIHSTETFKLPVVKNPCPEDSHTKREEMKQLVSDLEKRFPIVRDRLLTAFKKSNPDHLWKMP
ncbi:MAG: ATP-binding protein [Syntrophaceticus sp.]|nr:ATP-binding protein [Syntrophaceticus sp.]